VSSAFIPREQIRDARPWAPTALVERRKGDRRGSGPEESRTAAPGEPPPTPIAPDPAPPPAIDLEAERRRIAAEREVILEQARDEGFLAGLADGRKSARNEIARLGQVIASFDAALAAEQPRLAEALVDLAIDLARAVIRREIALDRTVVMAVVEEALRSLPEGVNGGELHLHPDDVTLVRERLAALDDDGTWHVIPSGAVERGGCRVVTRACEIDGLLGTRWKRALESFGRDIAPFSSSETDDG